MCAQLSKLYNKVMMTGPLNYCLDVYTADNKVIISRCLDLCLDM